MNPLKWLLNKVIPQDSDDSAGYGPFRLPSPECDWMQRVARLHDISFRESATSGERLSEADAKLFWRWVFEANHEDDPIVRCRKFDQICTYWPIARKFGRYLWDGK